MFIRNCNSFMKIFSLLMIMSALILSYPVNAQQLPVGQSPQPAEYTDAVLITFINAAQKIMPLQQESQIKMIETIEDEDLTVDKFNSILESRSAGSEADATQTELLAFNNAIEGIQDIQLEYEGIITDAITEEGITPAKYEEIITNYQHDPELQMRINVLMEEMEDQ